jgi:hypothetical protein
MTQQLQTLIEAAWDNRASLSVPPQPERGDGRRGQVIAMSSTPASLRVATRERRGPVDRAPVDQKGRAAESFRLNDNAVDARG